MIEIVTILIVYLVSLNISAFFGVGLLSLFFQFKKKKDQMNKGSWNRYFEKIGPQGLLIRLYISYMFALSILSAANYFVFFDHSLPYSLMLLAAGIFHLGYKYHLNKDQIKQKFN
jgi:hypothetical protein